MGRIERIVGAALDLIYPPSLYCACCGKIIDESRTYRLCNECMDGIKWIGDRLCVKCGRRLNESNPTDMCFSCREHPHNYDRGYTCTEYGTHERAMVFALKYDGRSDIASVIGEIMADRMLAEFTPSELQSMFDIILPVPIHTHKKNKRGYNQAALIAEMFAHRTGLNSDDTVLTRTKETHVMKYLGPDQRRENIRGAFAVARGRENRVSGKNVMLIDDIYTTGATVDEIAHLLKDNGATRIDCLTFACGADMIKA